MKSGAVGTLRAGFVMAATLAACSAGQAVTSGNWADDGGGVGVSDATGGGSTSSGGS